MAPVVRPLTGAGVASAPASGPERQSSRLFPTLVGRLNPARRLTVLDVGPAVPETVRFFGQFRCRLHIGNFFEESLVREEQGEADAGELRRGFADLLHLPRGTLIDVCLFWDFLNYLTPKSLSGLGAALRPYVHKGTRGHGFSVLNVETPLHNRQYGIVDSETLCSRPATLAQLPYFPHTHEELNECLGIFRIERGWLLSDGRLEMALASRI